MNGFIEWLDSHSQRDSRVRAVLKRSLAFEPGTFIPAFPYVEPFLQASPSTGRRQAFYLAAGLWASHGHSAGGGSVGRAAALHKIQTGSSSIEARFIAMLDADEDQLPHRLRQMVALLKDQPIDFEALVVALLHWQSDFKRTQNDWARDFYRTLQAGAGPAEQPITFEEIQK